ncbi:MAG: hypothetical protein ACE148_09830 [Vicinamibacterales bacterium]
MSEKKGWGSTVLGWFVVQEDEAAGGMSAQDILPADGAVPATDTPGGRDFFQKAPPVSPGGVVDFDAVFDAAGIAGEEQDRVTKASELLKSLPAEAPVEVRKQIVEASLRAFGVPIDKIIEAGVAEIQALEGYIRVGAGDTQALLRESEARIRQYEEEIRQIRTVMTERVREQEGVARACNDRKLAVQQILEFFGQEAVARVVATSPKLRPPGQGAAGAGEGA